MVNGKNEIRNYKSSPLFPKVSLRYFLGKMSAEALKMKQIFGVPCHGRTPQDLSDQELTHEILQITGIIVRTAHDAADDRATPRAYQQEFGSFQTDGSLAPLLSEALRRNGNNITALLPPDTEPGSPLITQIPAFVSSSSPPSVGLEYDIAKGILGLSTEQLDRNIGLARFNYDLRGRMQQLALAYHIFHGRPN